MVLFSAYSNVNQLLCIHDGSSVGEESAGDPGLIPGLGRSTGEGIGYPLQYSGLENSMDCIVHGVAKSRTRLSDFHFHTFVASLPPPSYPSGSSQSTELSSRAIRQLPACCLTHGSVARQPYSLSHLLLPRCPVSTSQFSPSASLFLPCKQVRQYHFSRFRIFSLIHDIC